MKNFLLKLTLLLLTAESVSAYATLVLEAEIETAELQATNNKTSEGFIGHGGPYLWEVKYAAKPGTYTITGKSPGCPMIVESASFENEKSYRMILKEDCRIERSTS